MNKTLQLVSDKLGSTVGDITSYVKDDKNTAYVIGGVGAIALLGALCVKRNRDKPTTFELSGGSIEKAKVKKEWDNYASSFGEDGTGQGIKDRSKTVELVDVFYSLVTDIYEWGWGQSFHFSPKLPGAFSAACLAALIRARCRSGRPNCICANAFAVALGNTC